MKKSLPLRASGSAQPLAVAQPSSHRSLPNSASTPVLLITPPEPAEVSSEPLVDGAAFKKAVMAEYQPTDPLVLAQIELTAQVLDNYLEVQKVRLDPYRGFFVLDREGRTKRPAANHLSDMLLALSKLLRDDQTQPGKGVVSPSVKRSRRRPKGAGMKNPEKVAPLVFPAPSTSQTTQEPIITTKAFREALARKYQPTDPVEWVQLDLVVQAYDDRERVRRSSLNAEGQLILLDVETKVKRRPDLHLRDMLLVLHDLCQRPVPQVRIVRAEKTSSSSPQAKTAKKSANI